MIVSRAVVGVLFPIMMEKRECQGGFIIIEAILERIVSQGRNQLIKIMCTSDNGHICPWIVEIISG